MLAGACTEVDEPGFLGGDDPLHEGTWAGQVPDGGFGSRLASDGSRVWASSPFAARVDELTTRGALGNSLTSEGGSFFGAGLATVGGALAVGSPGRGELLVDGVIVATEPGLGGVVASDGTRWAASTPSGWRSSDGAIGTLGRRPDALVWSEGAVVAGAAFGTTAMWAGVPMVAHARNAATDELGFALASCPDKNGAGVVWAGAPGAGTIVPAGGAPLGPGTGRFGAAIACGSEAGVLFVGAPGADEHAGALYRVEGGAAVQVLSGAESDELGTAVLVAGGRVFVGAPGGAESPGRVLAIPEAELAR